MGFDQSKDVPRRIYVDPVQLVVIVQVDNEETAKMIASQVPIFEALIKGCKEVKIVTKDSDVPGGCGTEQISVQAIVHVPVKVRSTSYKGRRPVS